MSDFVAWFIATAMGCLIVVVLFRYVAGPLVDRHIDRVVRDAYAPLFDDLRHEHEQRQQERQQRHDH